MPLLSIVEKNYNKKPQKFTVTNFRSVIDSGWVNCEEITTLVGITPEYGEAINGFIEEKK